MPVIVTCKSDIFEKYINSYKYSCDAGGFIEPIEEFKEWFDYIVDFYNIYDNGDKKENYNGFLIKQIDSSFEKISTLIFSNDYFDFEFPDEDTALYFKLKFCS